MALSLEAFQRELVESGLISPEDLRALWAEFSAKHPPSSGDQLGQGLVRQGHLTEYQAQQICAGNGAKLVLGNYVVLDKLGQGGMGLVLKAEHQRMKRLVAIKMLSPAVTGSPEALRRFQREVEAAARLEHPHVVTAYDADEANGTHFLVMQFVAGIDLSALVKTRGPLPVEQALACVIQAARGLEYAHARGIVHRDIKPGNLLLDGEGTVRVLDLGLARMATLDASDDDLTGTGEVMGTIDYMAPEQALDTKNADPRADIYSLGATLWYLLTGRAMFEGNSVKKLLDHQTGPVPSLTSAGLEVSPALEAVFARMVAKSPQARYPNMGEVLADLERCQAEVIDAAFGSGLDMGSRSKNILRDAEATIGRDLPPTAVLPEIAATVQVQSPVDTDPQVVPASSQRSIEVLPQAQSVSRSKWTWILLSGGALLLCLVLVSVIYQAVRERLPIAKPGGPGRSSTGTGWEGWGKDAPEPARAPFDKVAASEHQAKWANHLGLPPSFVNSIGMEFVLIPPGEFQMGSSATEIEAALQDADPGDKHWPEYIRSEGPQHAVAITQPFYLGVCEVTAADYDRGAAENDSGAAAPKASLSPANCPKTASWNEAVRFCASLSKREKLKPCYVVDGESVTPQPGNGYRLPTEAQWEYACRAGTTTPYWVAEKDLQSASWFGSNSDGHIRDVGKLRANPFGLFDTLGNAWEWTDDGWTSNNYGEFQSQGAVDPRVPFVGSAERVIRGGSWRADSITCRSAVRGSKDPASQYDYIGFRISLPVEAVALALKK